MNDIDIIYKQTNIDRTKIIELYEKNNKDIIQTICEIEGYIEEQKEKIKLNEIQIKIKELREIVENKDMIMDNLKENL